MTIGFLTSPAVSITNGSSTLNVTGNVDTYRIYNGTTIVIGSEPVIAVVEGISGSGQPDGSGNSTITLKEPWSLTDVVNEPMVAFNTSEGMFEAQRYAREAAINIIALTRSNEELLTSTDPTVTIEINGVPAEFVPYQYLVEQFNLTTLDSIFAGHGIDGEEDIDNDFSFPATNANQFIANAKKYRIGDKIVSVPQTTITLPDAPNSPTLLSRKDLIYLLDNGSYGVFEGTDDNPTMVDAGFTDQGKGLWSNGANNAVVIGRQSRLNQGAYHPSYNYNGCPLVRDGSAYFWYTSPASTITSTGDCFTKVDANSGFIGAGNVDGRSDQYAYYDAIYKGMFEDLRIQANKQEYSRLLEDNIRKAIIGKTRGKGRVKSLVRVIPTSWTSQAQNTTSARGYFSFTVPDQYHKGSESNSLILSDVINYFDENIYGVSNNRVTTTLEHGWISWIKLSGTWYVSMYSNFTFPHWVNASTGVINQTIPVTDDLASIEDAFVCLLSSQEYDSLPYVDIVGNPERIAATFLNSADSVIGQWNPELPIGSSNEFPLNRKSNSSNASVVYTTDNGVSWNTSNRNLDNVKNSDTASWSVNIVALYHYESLSDFTESENNSVILGSVGDVLELGYFTNELGNRLIPSLIDVVNISDTSGKSLASLSATSITLNNVGAIDSHEPNAPIHTPFDLSAPNNDSNSVKALYSLTEKNGLIYMQYHGRQMIYDVDWGDDNTIPVGDGDYTVTDDNGNISKAFCHHSIYPIGFAY